MAPLLLYEQANTSPRIREIRRPQLPRFRIGDLVKVARNQGFIGSYCEATMVADFESDYVIEYETLVTDDLLAPLREVVSTAEVRLRPPEVAVAEYRIHDAVDALDNDGWWVGRITGRVDKRYWVFFDTTGDEIAYAKDRLRIHQDWMKAKWFC